MNYRIQTTFLGPIVSASNFAHHIEVSIADNDLNTPAFWIGSAKPLEMESLFPTDNNSRDVWSLSVSVETDSAGFKGTPRIA